MCRILNWKPKDRKWLPCWVLTQFWHICAILKFPLKKPQRPIIVRRESAGIFAAQCEYNPRLHPDYYLKRTEFATLYSAANLFASFDRERE